MATDEEVRALISMSDCAHRARYAAILAQREHADMLTCETCGKERKHRQRNQRFCSPKCRLAAHRANAMGKP